MRPDVQLWYARFGPEAGWASLDRTEREKARRFHFERHRSRYVFAHGVLRSILGGACGIAPGDLQFVSNAYGKPALASRQNARGIAFNMSHSGDLVAIALAEGGALGVDIEAVRPLDDMLSIARQNFAPEELALLNGAGADEREATFYRCWVRKESYIKAVGKGLSIPLPDFDTSFPAGEERALPRTPDAPDIDCWSVADLTAPAGFAGALTVAGPPASIQYFDWLSEGD